MANTDWTRKEVELIVADYFNMLQLELEERDYNKSEHRRALQPLLNARSERAIESKHQNISAVLLKIGLPHIKGYKPLFHYQKELMERQVANYLQKNISVFERDFENFANKEVSAPANYQIFFDYILDNDLPENTKVPDDEPSFHPIKVNYLEREQNNRKLGQSGEELVISYEKWRLTQAGKENLADKIEWVSQEQGDGAGYDILSKNIDGSDKYIEVKTTKLSKETPIYLTKNELAFAVKNAQQFYLYRVFNFDVKPQFFIRSGSYEDCCKLEALTFKGYF